MSAAPASARAHAAAVLARLQGTANLAAHHGHAPHGAAAPYVVLDFDAAAAAPGSLADRWSLFECLFAVRAVGETAEQALWAADLARTALLTDSAIAVSGRTSHPVTQESRGATARDDSVTPPLYVSTVVYRWMTTP